MSVDVKPQDETRAAPPTTSWDKAQAAFKLIFENGPGPDPKSYAVWYEYAAQSQTALNVEIDEILGQGSKLSAGEMQHLYETFLASDRDTEEQFETLSLAIQDKVAGAQSLVTEVISNTDEYVASLDKAKDLLPSDMTQDQLVGAIEGILETGRTSKKSAETIQVALQSTHEEIDHLNSKAVQVREHMMRDTLTELINRQKFETLLAEKSAEALNNGYSLTTMILRVKNIQALNESAGMDISEFILKSVSGILRNAVGDKGTCARFSGPVFAIMMPRSVYRDAGKVAKSIIEELDIFKIVKRPSGQFVGHIQCAIGGTSLRAGLSSDDLIKLAAAQAHFAKSFKHSAVKFDLTNQRAA
ncbi:MAG: GGDEF domain-containing protein [Pseudomonadota bacterium]